MTIDFEAAQIRAYFAHVAARLNDYPEVTVVAIAHMVPNSVHFLPAVADVANLKLLLPKPQSESRPELSAIKQQLPRLMVQSLRRGWAEDADAVVDLFKRVGIAKDNIVIVDIGGYFAQSVDELNMKIPGRIVGVMEGTENGVQKYERSLPITVPVMTVARSPLKLPEDFLVASSVIFSVESVLRDQAQILQNRTACVIGYGRVGRGLAAVLRGRGIATVVHDKDPIAMAEAAAQGFQVFRRLDAALSSASLVLCATGNRALDKFGFASVRNGAVVATVTSGDDELDLDALHLGYEPSRISEHITRYEEAATSRYFWLINNGDAANFIHGAVIGPAIQLIEGEKLAAISELASGNVPNSYTTPREVDDDRRRLVASIWNEHFLTD